MTPSEHSQPQSQQAAISHRKIYASIGCLVIFTFSLLVFSYDRNIEFQGNDDYIQFCECAVYSTIRLLPESLTRDGLLHYGRATIKPFIHAPHNLLPAFAYGVFYRIADTLRVPFTVRTIHLPIAAISALCCLLFFLLLARNNFGFSVVILGTFLLIFSPLFSMESRGIATYFVAYIPFAQVAALFCLRNLSDQKSTKMLAGLALLNVALSDMLFFLTLPAFALAYGWRDSSLSSFWREPRAFGRQLVRGMRPLWDKFVLLPPALAIAWWVIVTLYSLLASQVGVWHPVTPLYRLASHTGQAGSMLLRSPLAFHDYASVLLGEAFPYLFLIGVVLHSCCVRTARTGLLWSFGIVGSVGFGILWYLLVRKDWAVKNVYQVYLVVPLLLVFISVLDSFVREHTKYKYVAVALLSIALLSAAAGHVSYVWRMPTALSRTAFSDWTHGGNNPNTGTKAVGYLLRQALESVCAHRPTPFLRLYAKPPSTSLEVFGGLMFRGAYYQKRFGITPDVSVEQIDDVSRLIGQETRAALHLCVVLDFRPGPGEPGTEPAATSRTADRARYDIVSDGALIASLWVVPAEYSVNVRLTPRAYTLQSLEHQYDATYHRLADFFPGP